MQSSIMTENIGQCMKFMRDTEPKFSYNKVILGIAREDELMFKKSLLPEDSRRVIIARWGLDGEEMTSSFKALNAELGVKDSRRLYANALNQLSNTDFLVSEVSGEFCCIFTGYTPAKFDKFLVYSRFRKVIMCNNSLIYNGTVDKFAEALDGIEEFAKNPVEFKTQAYGTVDSYGVAFTPLFLCIGLWVGALMAYVVLFYDQKHRFGIFDSKNSNNFMQNLAYILIGVAQGVIVGFLLKVGLGFKVDNLLLYYFASILIGITFMSIIQFFIKNFGDVGKFLALVVLVLQLAASGGTFPIETINKGFQLVTPYLPMTYSIKLLREILVPTATNFKGNYILILTEITVFCLVVTYIVDVIKAKKQKA